MKCLNSNQSVKEFNENFKDRLKYGLLLSNADDIKLIIELLTCLQKLEQKKMVQQKSI